MYQLLYHFLQDEDGQDIIEYTLLITFIAIATAAVVGSGQGAIRGIWSAGNDALASASTSAS